MDIVLLLKLSAGCGNPDIRDGYGYGYPSARPPSHPDFGEYGSLADIRISAGIRISGSRGPTSGYRATSGCPPVSGYRPISGYQPISGYRPISGYPPVSGYRPAPSYPTRPSSLRPAAPDHLGLEGKRLQAAASFPLRGGVAWTNVQETLSSTWPCFNLNPECHFTSWRGKTLGQVHCH